MSHFLELEFAYYTTNSVKLIIAFAFRANGSSLLRLAARRSYIIVGFASTWLVGLWLGHVGWSASIVPAIVAVLMTILIVKTRLAIAAAAVAGLAAGMLYGHQSITRYAAIESLIGHKVTLAGTISDDAAVDDKGEASFTLSNLRQGNIPLAGDVTIYTLNAHEQRGFEVQVSGKLVATLGSKQGRISYATVQIISSKQSALERWRQRFIAGAYTALPDPLSGFALGLLIGARSLIPKALQDQLALVGLSHLVAVSGYNLTIMVEAARRPLKRTSRYIALAVPLWLIGSFAVVAGLSASIVRAVLVTSLSLWAHYFGRQIKPLVLVAFPAFLTTLWRPDYLWNDVGWQLSFLAFFGILVLAPQIEARLRRPNWVKRLLIEAFAAQLLTFPIILLVFKQFSVIGLLANAIILPLVPLAMLASLIAGLTGAFIPILGILTLPAYATLKLMLYIINQLAGLPWASLTLEASGLLVGLVYAAIGLISLALSRNVHYVGEPSDIIASATD